MTLDLYLHHYSQIYCWHLILMGEEKALTSFMRKLFITGFYPRGMLMMIQKKWLNIFLKYKKHLLLRICFRLTVGNTLRGNILILVCLYELLSSNVDIQLQNYSTWQLRDCSSMSTQEKCKIWTDYVRNRTRLLFMYCKHTPHGSTERNSWEEHISTLSRAPLLSPLWFISIRNVRGHISAYSL